MSAEETTKAPQKDSSIGMLSKGTLARIKLLLDDESKAKIYADTRSSFLFN